MAISLDNGSTFEPLHFDPRLLDPAGIEGCQASIFRPDNGTRVFFSNPHNALSRVDMTVQELNKTVAGAAQPWSVLELVQSGGAAYSCLAGPPNSSAAEIGLLYEAAKPGCGGHACQIRYLRIPTALN